jgi:hypothetical protein
LNGGTTYTIPTSSFAVAGAIGGTPTSLVGYGVVSASGSNSTGLAIGTANHLVVPITYANSSVAPF